RTDRQIEMAVLGVVEPYGLDDGAQVALNIQGFLQHRLNRLRPKLKARHVAHQKIEPLNAVGVPGGIEQRLGFLCGSGRILLVADTLEELLRRRGEFREGIDESVVSNRRLIIEDLDVLVTGGGVNTR